MDSELKCLSFRFHSLFPLRFPVFFLFSQESKNWMIQHVIHFNGISLLLNTQVVWHLQQFPLGLQYSVSVSTFGFLGVWYERGEKGVIRTPNDIIGFLLIQFLFDYCWKISDFFLLFSTVQIRYLYEPIDYLYSQYFNTLCSFSVWILSLCWSSGVKYLPRIVYPESRMID